jgi:glycosyltransferase involved in cell wall biosynthesis
VTRTLAMDCSFLRDTTDLPSVFGFDVAVKGLVDALLRHGTYDRYTFFHVPGEPADSLAALRARLPRGAELQLESRTQIPRLIKDGGLTTWFQPDTTTEWVNYRSAIAPTPFPFSTVIHIACAPRLIRTQFLWMLLDGFAPCDAFICTSRAVRTAVRDTLDYIAEEMRQTTGATLPYRGRLDVLPLGIDTDRFTPRPKPEMRRGLGWPEDAFIVLWYGRFSVVDKGDLLPALRMFRRLLEANPHRRLLFVLAGTDRRDVPFVPAMRDFAEALGIAEHVWILDGTPQETRHQMFAAADVFTSPVDNLQETFGITPIEAMASGTPQVVSDWNGYKDTVVHGVTGYRVPTCWARCDGDEQTDYGLGGFGYQGYLFAQSVALDLREYQAAMQRLIDDPGLCAAMSAASRRRALDVFSWTAVIGAYEALWTELAAIAQRLSVRDLPAVPFARAALCRRFASFPTAMLGGDEPIAISEDGARLLARIDPFPWHSSRERDLVDADAILVMLESVRGEPGSFEEVVARLTANKTDRQPAVRRALLWGVKHGLLECTVSARPDLTPGFVARAPETPADRDAERAVASVAPRRLRLHGSTNDHPRADPPRS